METKQQNKKLALELLKKLLTEVPAITADIFYQKLRDEGFTEDEAVRATGAAIRSGAALGWMKKTNLCQNSKKNHSNLQKIWKSNLWDAKKDCRAALKVWAERGFPVPVEQLGLWEQMQAGNVSKAA